MPTGYTSGIIDGNLKTFKDFAMLSSRAFGATIHMRDESLDKPYEKRKPSNYYVENIERAKKRIYSAKRRSDKRLIRDRKRELRESIIYHQKRLDETNESVKRLNSFLDEAKAYKPPTKEHIGIKKFMIEQIEETIKWDGNTSYHKEAIANCYEELKNLSARKIRKAKLAQAKKELRYYTKSYRDEVKRCKTANLWVERYFNSLK